MLIPKHYILSIVIAMLVGCASIGPSRLHMDRGTYNDMVRKTEEEQLLLNIVRARYLEVMEFIQVGSLTASYSLSQTMTGSINATLRPTPTNISTSLSPTVFYSDSPTITYIPLSNAEFAKSLMTPVTMLNFLLSVHAGRFDYMALMELFFERINKDDSNVLNRRGISYTTADHDRFDKVMHLLNLLYDRSDIQAPRAVMFNKQLGIMLRFKKHSANTATAIKLKKLLRLSSNVKEIVFIEGPLNEELIEKNGIVVIDQPEVRPHNVVYVQLRSLLSTIVWLGYSVRVPCKDIKAHMTREVMNPDGTRHKVRLSHTMTIYSSDTLPGPEALVKVIFRGHWFYIKSSDMASKDTFDALMRLSTLTSAVATSTNNMPVLTIPLQK